MAKAENLIALENKYGANNYKPLDVVLKSGAGVWVTDVEGNHYMDMLSAYSALNQGHRHPRILEAAQAQLEKLTLTSRAFRNDQMGPFLEKLATITGKEKVLPMNTGAEAVETAIKAARKWGYNKKGVEPDQAHIIACDGNFHGRTTTIVGFSTEQDYKDGFGPFTPGFSTIPYGDAEALKREIEAKPGTVAFLVEPIQGEGGVIIPPQGYLKEVEQICRENNVLLMVDEIQTGLGRTGRMFAYEHEGVNPDIVIIGKALSGGFTPVSAIIANNDIMDVFEPGQHGSTFGGNPYAAAVASASLDVLVEEHLPEKAQEMGEYFMEKLEEINSPFIKEVRGKGLLIGVEVNGSARMVCEMLQEEGLLAKETHHTVVRFAPPLIISREEVDWAIEKIKEVFLQIDY